MLSSLPSSAAETLPLLDDFDPGNAELPLRPALVADHIVHHGRTKSITDFKDRRKNALSNEECNDNVDLQQVVVYSNGLEVCFQVIYLAISTVAHMRV